MFNINEITKIIVDKWIPSSIVKFKRKTNFYPKISVGVKRECETNVQDLFKASWLEVKRMFKFISKK